MFRLLFLEECTSPLLANRLKRLCFAYICGIAISKSNDVTTLSWDAVGWDGMGQSKLPWDGMGMGRETVSHGQPCVIDCLDLLWRNVASSAVNDILL